MDRWTHRPMDRYDPGVSRISLGPVPMGAGAPLVLIAGPCVIESADHALGIARELKRITSALGIPFVFKASYDKANRTSATPIGARAWSRA